MAGAYQFGRRGVLRGVVSIVGIGLAGCSEGPPASDGAESPTAETEAPESTELPPEVYAGVDDALVDLEAAQASYAEEIEKLPDSLVYVTFETGPIRGDLEAARANLDRAEEAAEGDPPAGIGTLRAIAGYFEGLVDGLARYDEGLGRLETAELYANNDRFEDGEGEAEVAVGAFEETVGIIEDAESARGAIDLAPLEGLIEASPAQIQLALDETAGHGDELRTYAEGMTFFVRGMVDYIIGIDHYQSAIAFAQEDAWDGALEEAQAAQSRFAEAEAASTAGEEAAPVSLLDRFLTLTCEASGYHEAAVQLEATIRAVVADDQAAQEAAFAALEEAELAIGAC